MIAGHGTADPNTVTLLRSNSRGREGAGHSVSCVAVGQTDRDDDLADNCRVYESSVCTLLLGGRSGQSVT